MQSKFTFRKRATSNASTQKGMSVVSVLLGLAITAAVAAVIYNQYSDSVRKARVEQAQAEIVTMVASAQKLYGNTNLYGVVTTATAVTSIVPARLRIAGTNTAQNVYNGAIEFAPATITSPNDSLVLTYGNVRREDCQDLILGSDQLMRRMAVGGTAVKAADGAIDVPALSTACDANAFSNINFAFGRGQ
ncbi:type 4 pilus major pilin [Variovorax sp. LT1P1]|uniref:type 4 pilus major pilin n=1 Tax=Variovorax sp. LT1P1 TaxID=3443730 RepID=UPI003F482106